MGYEFTSEIGSPGLGTTPIKLSAEPLATEGEATEGPDDEVNYEEIERAEFGFANVPAPEFDNDDFLDPLEAEEPDLDFLDW